MQAALDCKPHLNISYLSLSEMHSRRSRTGVFPVLMMLIPLQLPSVYHNPFCYGCARDAEENQIRKNNLVDKT